jgi:AcrR family transcriptional regulator
MDVQMARKRSARRRQGAARVQEEILAAAGRAFARHGYRATTVQDIAREAGYTAPSLYAYFDGKDAIFVELASRALDRFFAPFDQPVPADLDFAGKVELLLQRQFESADRNRDTFAFAVSALAQRDRPPGVKRMMAARHGGAEGGFGPLYSRWLRRHVAKKDLAPHGADILGSVLFGIVRTAFERWIKTGSKLLVDSVPLVVDLFLHGATGAGRSTKGR